MVLGIMISYKQESFMSFQQEYQRKLTTPDEAVKVVKTGDWGVFGW